MKRFKTDIIIVGTGASGLFAALHLPSHLRVVMLTKDALENSDSYLAQGGICVLRDESDYLSFQNDTLKAGHFENDPVSVDVMIRSSRTIIDELIGYGVEFATEHGQLAYTREGAHSRSRILYHADITGQEITGKLLSQVKRLENVTLLEYTTMVDLLEQENRCYGILARDRNGALSAMEARAVIWACGGIGGLYEHSTNFPHLTGDALALSLRHHVALRHMDYIQIHPTTLYSQQPGRRFLISESVRGEGGKLYNAKGERFTNEVLPRDLLTAAIRQQMALDQTPYVWLDMTSLGEGVLLGHFPHIFQRCLEEGYDARKDYIPVVPAQHYFMGGVKVDLESRTSMERLYAVGETSCNGVHGANRLASNSLLESLVFGKRAALDAAAQPWGMVQSEEARDAVTALLGQFSPLFYADGAQLEAQYKASILAEIKRERSAS